MPGPRLPMRKIRDVLRLSAAGMSKRKIAASLGMSATAAGECIRRARRAGLTWPLAEELTDESRSSVETELRAARKPPFVFSHSFSVDAENRFDSLMRTARADAG